MRSGGSPPKIARNKPCPCGSGRKYKHCHGGSTAIPTRKIGTPPEIEQILRQALAQEKQREKQQGMGRPIISALMGDRRFVAIGSQLIGIKKGKTFQDFLISYIPIVFGQEWLKAEIQRTEEPRHPLAVVVERAKEMHNRSSNDSGEVVGRVASGPNCLLLDLGYNLYLLRHNAQIQASLLERMRSRRPDDFYGAFYETMVAGILIRAGFAIEFENEGDPTSNHCEFTATCRRTGRRFSVEAKYRMEGKQHLDVGNQLRSALAKDAKYERLVFIEMNTAEQMSGEAEDEVVTRVLKILESREALKIDGIAAPPAYVVVTNNPYAYFPNSPMGRWAGAHGFKIPDLKARPKFNNLREMINSRDKHREIFDLMESIRDHAEIPVTFNGEIPEFALGEDLPRLIIGNEYRVPFDDGSVLVGVLRHADVSEEQKLAYCVFELPNGTNTIASIGLTEAELAAYRRHGDTFFGKYDPKSKRQMRDALDLYDWLLETNGGATKEQLLEQMKDAPDFEQIKDLPREELLSTRCERLVYGMMQAGVFLTP
jgi:SEC-C motif